MAEYENVVGGKLRLKGKALDVKKNKKGIPKKKKHTKYNIHHLFYHNTNTMSTTGVVGDSRAENNVDHENENENENETSATYNEQLTPAERRYLEQWKRVEAKRLLRNSCESHRDRINKFNEYLANLSEHYDIPKVGPG